MVGVRPVPSDPTAASLSVHMYLNLFMECLSLAHPPPYSLHRNERNGYVDLWVEDEFNSGSRLVVRTSGWGKEDCVFVHGMHAPSREGCSS